MPEVTIPIKQAGDTAANLASSNPTAYDKQLVLETDTLKFKVGDGVTAYNDLGYFNNAPGELTADELAAIQGAAAPSGANVFATMADVGSGLSIGDAIGGALNNQLLITDGSGNLSEIPNIIDSSGGGTLFLADDGTYKAVGGGDALTSNPLSQFASTTSLQLLGVMSDETGTGSLVFGTSPTLVTPNLGTPSTLIGTNITGTAAGLTVGATTGVEPGADVTDTANVTAAGAAMLTGADFTGDITTTGSVTAVDFIGNLNGAVQFTGINRSGVTINKGEAIYISGISGNTPEVGLADADNASSMPAFGLAAETAIDNANLEIITFGSLTGIKTDYSGWALGDTLYVSTTPGLLTDTPPTGESSLIQNIGTVERLHSSNGSIKVGGAGRTNATPNLDAGNIFYGNGSNQSTSVALNTLADLTDATNIAAAGGVIPTGTPDGSKFLRDDQVWTAIPAGGDALTSNPLSQFASTTSLQLLGVMSDETGTGSLVFGTSPTLVTPDLGTPSALVGTNITGTAAGLTVGATTGVEAGADVTDTANVTAAGALMDSEVVNLAQVKAFDSADYATAAQGTTADNALPTTGGAMTGAITTTSTFDGRDVAADGAKLDTIETNADVTDAANISAAGGVIPTGTPDGSKFLRDDEVWTTIPAGGDALTSNPLSQFAATTSAQLLGVMSDETGTGALVFATSPTLVTPNLGTPTTLVGTNITGTAAGLTVGATTGVEAGADVTDTANVTAAGALMDSEITNLAQVKAFDSADYATAAQGTTADNALPTTGGAMTGAITTTSTFDGRDVATDGAKLDGIEAGADVTDATNIAAAGGVIPTGTPDGTKFLRDDQVWTAIAAGGVAIGDAVGGSSINTLLFSDGSGNLGNNTKLTFNGTSFNFTGNSSTSSTCTSLGTNAGNGNTSNENTSIGNIANQSSSGLRKTAVGNNAGNGSSGNEGVFLGADCGKSSTGNRNGLIGYRSGMNMSGTGSNQAIGDYTLFASNGTQNVAFGTNAQNSATGSYNTGTGGRTLLFGNGSNNTAVGYSAGESNVASNVLCLGYQAGKSNSQSNRTIIGQTNLPQFAGAVAAAAALPAAGANGVYLYWDTTDDTIKARP